jgi:thiamine kinase-like enzyme
MDCRRQISIKIMVDFKAIFAAFHLSMDQYAIENIQVGLINKTYKLVDEQHAEDLILQNVNTSVFKSPEYIEKNTRLADEYLKSIKPDYLFIAPVAVARINNEYWRLLPYVPHSVSLTEITSTKQVYQAAKQFARLTKLLNDFPEVDALEETIPRFHDLNLRFNQYQDALGNASEIRLAEAQPLIEKIAKHSKILSKYNDLIDSKVMKLRPMHHDAKLSNVLLDEENLKGVCVIDLDTLMPGYILSDLGDMMRSMLCEENEESTNFDQLHINADYYQALFDGYLHEMKEVLSPQEEAILPFSGQYIIYMQAIRFLTDYLNNDVYYQVKYPEHNFNRAKNQLILLENLIAFQAEFHA